MRGRFHASQRGRGMCERHCSRASTLYAQACAASRAGRGADYSAFCRCIALRPACSAWTGCAARVLANSKVSNRGGVPGNRAAASTHRRLFIHWLDEQAAVVASSGPALQATRQPIANARRPVRGTPILFCAAQSAYLVATGDRFVQGAIQTSSGRKPDGSILCAPGCIVFERRAWHRLLKVELEEALGELVSRGLINADSFAGLRALLVPAAKRSKHARRTRRANLMGIEDAGRWALTRMPTPEATADQTREAEKESIEHVARILLRRYGVICWRLLARESSWLPPWRELLRVYRQLEARARFAGAVSSRACPASSSPCPKRSRCCARRVPHAWPQVVIAAAIRSIWSASWHRAARRRCRLTHPACRLHCGRRPDRRQTFVSMAAAKRLPQTANALSSVAA